MTQSNFVAELVLNVLAAVLLFVWVFLTLQGSETTDQCQPASAWWMGGTALYFSRLQLFSVAVGLGCMAYFYALIRTPTRVFFVSVRILQAAVFGSMALTCLMLWSLFDPDGLAYEVARWFVAPFVFVFDYSYTYDHELENRIRLSIEAAHVPCFFYEFFQYLVGGHVGSE